MLFFVFFVFWGPGEQISELSPAVQLQNQPNYSKPLLFFSFRLKTSSDVTGAAFLSWNLGHFGTSFPVLGNGVSLGLVGLFSCATLCSQPQTYKEHCSNVEHHWICENDGNYQSAAAGNDRGAVWDGPGVLLSPCWLRAAHRPADMM